jgi:hypothetical protein
MLKIEGQKFQEPEFTAKTQNSSARFLELAKAQNRKTSSRTTFKNSMLKTEGQNFQNPKLKAPNRSTRFQRPKLTAQNRSTYQILQHKTQSSKEYYPDFRTQKLKHGRNPLE